MYKMFTRNEAVEALQEHCWVDGQEPDYDTMTLKDLHDEIVLADIIAEHELIGVADNEEDAEKLTTEFRRQLFLKYCGSRI